MLPHKPIVGSAWRPVVLGLAAMVFAAPLSWAAAAAAGPPAASPPNMEGLLTQLAKEWLKEQGAAKPPAPVAEQVGPSLEDTLNADAGAIHDQIAALIGAIPALPQEFAQAAGRVEAVHGENGRARELVHLAVFVIFGFGVEWLFKRATRAVRRRLVAAPMETAAQRLHIVTLRFALAYGAVAAFTLGSLGPFLAFSWDPVLRETVLGYLIGVVAICLAVATGDFLLAAQNEALRILPMGAAAARFWRRRLIAFAGWFVFLWVILQECRTLGFSFDGQQLVGYALGLGVLAIALEAVWRRPAARPEAADKTPDKAGHFGGGAANIALTLGMLLLWVLWVAAPGVTSVLPAFWLVLVAMLLPIAIAASRRAVENLLRPGGSAGTGGPPGVVEVGLEHGIRALLIVGAVAVLAWGWGVDLTHLAGRNTLSARIVHGALTTIVILLIADVFWHAVRAAIDSKLAETADLSQPNSDEARRRARLHTLLPIFRNILFFLVVAIAVMMALAELGVEIGPLIAGASVVGVAIGFGAQTFVRDVIAGMFYLLDDAFRVGEYIQAGRYKGTVEGFSIRSIKLRHHRGPVFTVPFSLLGAVENMSRDWVIDKIAIGVTYDSDLVLARKLIKQIGLDLAHDPEFAPLIIEPLKMQGVEQLADFAVQIRAKMMTLPGEQFVIRRQAYAMIKKAFDENGIKFAFPTVQIAGDGDAAAGAAARRVLEITQPAAAE